MQDLVKLFDDFRKGDRAAFHQIYQSYYPKLVRYGYIFSSDLHTIENVIQDFFVKMLHRPDRLSHVINVEQYLYKTAKQNLLTILEKEERRAVIRKLNLNSVDIVPSPEEKMISDESYNLLVKWMKEQLTALPTRQKEIIYLRYYENFSYKKIEQITGLSSQVARNYATRAINKIRNKANPDEHLETSG